jgi:acetyl-CoA acetyltransferase/uncharacterized OB-fold protein
VPFRRPRGGKAVPLSAQTAGAAITGLGMTDLGKVYGRSPRRLAADAVRRALADAGLAPADLDGLLVCPGITGGLDVSLAAAVGLRDLRLLATVSSFGASACTAVEIAALAVTSGAARYVACVFADAPRRRGVPAGTAFGTTGGAGEPGERRGLAGLAAGYGYRSVTARYALAARRHMETFGSTSEQLGAIAVAQRQWAAGNPLAQLREPLTLADHQASRWIAEPLHLLDCSLVSNGGIAVIVTTAERAAAAPRPPVHVWGWGQGHPGYQPARGSGFGLVTGAAQAGPAAMGMAGIGPAAVTMCQLYDCYTYTVLVSLEDYGFCAKGEGGELAASGALGPGGSLPVNTGGGQLSAYYMWGFTPLSEAVIQARNDGGGRQSASTDVILVSGNGGILDHHATLILSPHARSPRGGTPMPGGRMPGGRMPGGRVPAGRVPAAEAAGAARADGAAGGGPKAAGPAAGPEGPAAGPEGAVTGPEGAVTVPPAPVIRRDERSTPFFDAAAAGRLLIRRCAECGRWLAPEAGGCHDCGAEDPGWAPASGHGTLVSWAVLHPRGSPPGQPAALTVLALVELDEGPWLHTGLAVTSPEAIAALRAGQRVAASFVHPADGESYPVFTPVPAAEAADPPA